MSERREREDGWVETDEDRLEWEAEWELDDLSMDVTLRAFCRTGARRGDIVMMLESVMEELKPEEDRAHVNGGWDVERPEGWSDGGWISIRGLRVSKLEQLRRIS